MFLDLSRDCGYTCTIYCDIVVEWGLGMNVLFTIELHRSDVIRALHDWARHPLSCITCHATATHVYVYCHVGIFSAFDHSIAKLSMYLCNL